MLYIRLTFTVLWFARVKPAKNKILKKKSGGTTNLQRSEERKDRHFFRPLRELVPDEDKTGGPVLGKQAAGYLCAGKGIGVDRKRATMGERTEEGEMRVEGVEGGGPSPALPTREGVRSARTGRTKGQWGCGG